MCPVFTVKPSLEYYISNLTSVDKEKFGSLILLLFILRLPIILLARWDLHTKNSVGLLNPCRYYRGMSMKEIAVFNCVVRIWIEVEVVTMMAMMMLFK